MDVMLGTIVIGEHPEISFTVPVDREIELKYNGETLKCNLQKISKDHGTSYSVMYLYQLAVTVETEATIKKFLFEANKKPGSLLIYHYNSRNNYWKRYGKVQKRDESTFILDKAIKDNLLSDVMKFTTAEPEYEKYGMPYKRNYLFYGKPGTGKTSLANVIANKTDRSIYIISFDSEMSDNGLYSAINSINNEDAILLLEDIDCIFQDRMTNMNNSRVSFSALLNVLDGVTRSKGLITIITTNYVKKLDAVLTRPGRVDMIIEFSTISEEQIRGLLKLYERSLNSKNLKRLVKICVNKELTPSILSGFMFRKRHDTLDNENFIELFEVYFKEFDVKGESTAYINMFA